MANPKNQSALSVVKNLVTGKGGIPYNYVVGAKDSAPSPIPFDVKLSVDPDFKKTIIKTAWIFSGFLALGVTTGIIISNSKKTK